MRKTFLHHFDFTQFFLTAGIAAATIKVLREKISTAHAILNQYPWEFSKIPHIPITTQCSTTIEPGKIEFSYHLCFNQEKENIELMCNDNGTVSLPPQLNMHEFFAFKEMTIDDNQSYPIKYGLFRTHENPAPTVMIIEGGPSEFVDFKKFNIPIGLEETLLNTDGCHSREGGNPWIS